ncbi:protein phosphatase 2C domain-containing protein [Fervidobacterium sp. 2310opik-2]|uniref:PP2C family protein-serine/threonine phosphatase n=1 Tax=Fervidobacterium sp. 2310opik-2 TaxID=1755815 RepID=UPI0013E020D3|nr:protein phosphatase 2C domain-containing protein [Fervidobacterium sp. 2310opik-2]KAF2961323.1 hypothetical protein AS161_01900 [Fervidobacterium sp. 2310opik-2]
MAFVQSMISEEKLLKFKGINWSKDFNIFSKRPRIKRIVLPIVSELIPDNEFWFLFDETLKPVTQALEVNKDRVVEVIFKIMEIFEETETQGYKFFIIDPKSIYLDENFEPYIFVYYPIFAQNDLFDLSTFNMPITLKSKNSDFKNNNSYIIAELFAQLKFGNEYRLINNFKSKKHFVRHKLIEEGEYDLVKWFEKSYENIYSIRTSKEELIKAVKRKERRQIEEKKVVKIKRAFRTFEGTRKLKPEDDYVDDSNQDSYYCDIFENKAIFAVMDGVSTAKIGNGKLASNITRDVLKEEWEEFKIETLESKLDSEKVRGFFEKVINKANEKILDKAKELSKNLLPGEIMSTTLAAVVMEDDNIYICSVGDSNIYVISNDYFTKLNVEHNVKTLRLLNKEKINDSDSSLTQYIGKYKIENNEIVCDEIKFYFNKTKLLNNETLFISSDGVLDYWNGFNQEEKEENFFKDYLKMLEELKTLKAVSQRVISTLDFNDANDNVTLILLTPEFSQESK